MNRQSPASLLLATDRLASPLLEAGAASARVAYTPYGYRPAGMQSRMGFTGQLREIVIGWYMLGNGHRVYNPILMRFCSPDRLSPFGEGGINGYAYCSGDPINRHDPTGQIYKNAPVKPVKPAKKLGKRLTPDSDLRALFESAGPSQSPSLVPQAPDLLPNVTYKALEGRIEKLEAMVSENMSVITSSRKPGSQQTAAEKQLFGATVDMIARIAELKVESSTILVKENAAAGVQYGFPEELNNNETSRLNDEQAGVRRLSGDE